MRPNFSNPRKRRREAANVDVKLVEIYEDLANEKNEIRLKAAAGLLSRFTPPNSVPDEEAEKILHRLFRGLCSSRKAARIGFSIALTELLSTILGPASDKSRPSSIDVPKILHILETLTKVSGSANGQVRDGELL
jgi:DNA polymerase phi